MIKTDRVCKRVFDPERGQLNFTKSVTAGHLQPQAAQQPTTRSPVLCSYIFQDLEKVYHQNRHKAKLLGIPYVIWTSTVLL